MPEIGKVLVVVGIALALLGLVLWAGLGKLPGDIRIERGGGGFYFPIVTCIVLSILLSVLLAIFRR